MRKQRNAEKACVKALFACRLLVNAYKTGRESGGSIEWDDLDIAHDVARDALRLLAKKD